VGVVAKRKKIQRGGGVGGLTASWTSKGMWIKKRLDHGASAAETIRGESSGGGNGCRKSHPVPGARENRAGAAALRRAQRTERVGSRKVDVFTNTSRPQSKNHERRTKKRRKNASGREGVGKIGREGARCVERIAKTENGQSAFAIGGKEERDPCASFIGCKEGDKGGLNKKKVWRSAEKGRLAAGSARMWVTYTPRYNRGGGVGKEEGKPEEIGGGKKSRRYQNNSAKKKGAALRKPESFVFENLQQKKLTGIAPINKYESRKRERALDAEGCRGLPFQRKERKRRPRRGTRPGTHLQEKRKKVCTVGLSRRPCKRNVYVTGQDRRSRARTECARPERKKDRPHVQAEFKRFQTRRRRR